MHQSCFGLLSGALLSFMLAACWRLAFLTPLCQHYLSEHNKWQPFLLQQGFATRRPFCQNNWNISDKVCAGRFTSRLMPIWKIPPSSITPRHHELMCLWLQPTDFGTSNRAISFPDTDLGNTRSSHPKEKFQWNVWALLGSHDDTNEKVLAICVGLWVWCQRQSLQRSNFAQAFESWIRILDCKSCRIPLWSTCKTGRCVPSDQFCRHDVFFRKSHGLVDTCRNNVPKRIWGLVELSPWFWKPLVIARNGSFSVGYLKGSQLESPVYSAGDSIDVADWSPQKPAVPQFVSMVGRWHVPFRCSDGSNPYASQYPDLKGKYGTQWDRWPTWFRKLLNSSRCDLGLRWFMKWTQNMYILFEIESTPTNRRHRHFTPPFDTNARPFPMPNRKGAPLQEPVDYMAQNLVATRMKEKVPLPRKDSFFLDVWRSANNFGCKNGSFSDTNWSADWNHIAVFLWKWICVSRDDVQEASSQMIER